jgi:phospholipid N-methyltransferase
MFQTLRDNYLFIREFTRRFETTGSILPSSRSLASAITRHLACRSAEPIRVLECGPGTGVFTNQIVHYLHSGDSFDVVELNPAFADFLRHRFATDRHWQTAARIASVHQMPLQKFTPSDPYDFIISGLPHINFPAAVVEQVLDCYLQLLKPGGTLSYFEYMYIRPIRKAMTLGIDRRRIKEVDALMNANLAKHQVCRDSIYLNVLPAWVQHLTHRPVPKIDRTSDNTNESEKLQAE